MQYKHHQNKYQFSQHRWYQLPIFVSIVGLKLLIDPILSSLGSESPQLCPSQDL